MFESFLRSQKTPKRVLGGLGVGVEKRWQLETGEPGRRKEGVEIRQQREGMEGGSCDWALQ